jgi:ABC-type lipoprotein release transport system permease subunit
MNEYLKIAWRNLWRNRRRSLITISSVLFAVFLALLMRSMQLGTYDYMIESAVKNSTGYVQLHQAGYWDDKSIDNTMVFPADLDSRIRQTEYVTEVIPRLESFALISSGQQAKGVAVIGTDPETEDRVSGLQKRLIVGEFLQKGGSGLLVAEGLAQYLKVGVGDSLVLLGQGYHGVTAAGEYPVLGIIGFVQPDMNNQLVYMDLLQAQDFYSSPGRLTSVSVMLSNPDRMHHVQRTLSEIDPANLEVMTWKELLKELVQYIEGDNISGLFMLSILYLVVGFGILGTVLMMTMERRKEFGIMVAVGMKRYKLSLIILMESLILGITGVVAGIALSLPFVTWFHFHPIRLTGDMAEAVLEYNMDPIMPFALEPGFFISQGIVVLGITLLALLYPVMSISKLTIVNAIKGK